jgi:hypothetical protein
MQRAVQLAGFAATIVATEDPSAVIDMHSGVRMPGWTYIQDTEGEAKSKGAMTVILLH